MNQYKKTPLSYVTGSDVGEDGYEDYQGEQDRDGGRVSPRGEGDKGEASKESGKKPASGSKKGDTKKDGKGRIYFS